MHDCYTAIHYVQMNSNVVAITDAKVFVSLKMRFRTKKIDYGNKRISNKED